MKINYYWLLCNLDFEEIASMIKSNEFTGEQYEDMFGLLEWSKIRESFA